MSYGYNGKILHVNLTDATWEVEEAEEKWYRANIGSLRRCSIIGERLIDWT